MSGKRLNNRLFVLLTSSITESLLSLLPTYLPYRIQANTVSCFNDNTYIRLLPCFIV